MHSYTNTKTITKDNTAHGIYSCKNVNPTEQTEERIAVKKRTKENQNNIATTDGTSKHVYYATHCVYDDKIVHSYKSLHIMVVSHY